MLFELPPPEDLAFEAGAEPLLLTEGFRAGVVERVVARERVVVLRVCCRACGAVLRVAFWLADVDLRLTEERRSGVVERVAAPERVVVLRDGDCTCGAVLPLVAACPEEGVVLRLTEERDSGVVERVVVPWRGS